PKKTYRKKTNSTKIMHLPNYPHRSKMHAVACLTAWELTKENISSISDDRVHTPFGMFSNTIFFVGTLTEKALRNNQLSYLRISDPTGVLMFSIPPQNTKLIHVAEALDIPSFVAITATTKHRTYAGKTYLELIPDTLTQANRKIRDAWLCCAAISAIERIKGLPNSPERSEFKEILASALTNVQDEEITSESKPFPMTTEIQLLAIIAELSGKKGASITDVIKRAKVFGMTEIDCKKALSHLMKEDKCYTPTTELIKIV
ncbi:MAG TPA: hypothetical protein O0Y05_01775, partial [Methanocorpusculum sp.]|nr:hypothetical protein [Methanocorpusculum sp.]